MSAVGHWFSTQVQPWRHGAATAWTVLILPLLVLVCTSVAVVDIFHPLNCLARSFFTAISPEKWLYISVVCVSFGILTSWNARHFSVRPLVMTTRLAHLWNVLSPQRIVHAAVHCFVGALAAWCYTCIVETGYHNMAMPCPEDSAYQCINERHLFLMLHGGFVGWLYAILFFVQNKNHATFPIIQQSKFFQVKSNFSTLLVHSVKDIVWQLRLFYPLFYLILGPTFTRSIVQHINLNRSESATLGTLASLVDLGLLWHTVLSGSLTQLILSLAGYIDMVYLTQPFEFPIESGFAESQHRCLHHALSCQSNATVQYLGYLDLYLLSRHNAARRQELFSLSQPGGHPHNWNSICTQCVSMLQALTDGLTTHNNKVMASGSIRQPSGEKPAILSAIPERNLSTVDHLTQRQVMNISAMSSPAPASQLLSPAPPSQPITGSRAPLNSEVQQLGPVEEKYPPKPLSLWNKLWIHMKKRRPVSYFVAELPDTASQSVFADCQVAIWAAQALANISAASFAEDTYGVVQKSLAEIITVLLALQDAVEKHFKMGASINRKPNKGSIAAPDIVLRATLKTALKTSLYRIVTTFDKHLGAIQLSSEHNRRLRLFMEYKE